MAPDDTPRTAVSAAGGPTTDMADGGAHPSAPCALVALDDVGCQELAALAARCIAGFSDDRPVSASLVRSRLTNALTGQPPVLAVARAGRQMTGWCAVRRPEPGEEKARLWGPVVAPTARRQGLGGRLLATVVAASPWPLVSTDVPDDRVGAGELFTTAGWEELDTVTVLRSAPAAGRIEAVTAQDLPDLEDFVASAARRLGGHQGPFAASTLQRWQDDARFQRRNLLVDPASGALLLALAQHNGTSSELLLAEVWAPTAPIRRRLITAAHAAAADQGLAAVRAVTRDDPSDFLACGMSATGRCRTYTLPGDR